VSAPDEDIAEHPGPRYGAGLSLGRPQCELARHAGQRQRPVAPMGCTVATSPDGYVAGLIAPAQYISLVLNLSAQRWRHLSNRAPSGLGPSAQNAQVGTVDLWGRTRGAVAGPARRTARAASHK
jgi:hypothetical protein